MFLVSKMVARWDKSQSIISFKPRKLLVQASEFAGCRSEF